VALRYNGLQFLLACDAEDGGDFGEELLWVEPCHFERFYAY
jgi:hypothetical protein